MVKTKQAFSLAEIMVVMAIVGVVTVYMMIMFRPNEQALRNQYYNAYKTLSTASYNAYQKLEAENRKKEKSGQDPYKPVASDMRNGFAQNGTVLYAESDALCESILFFLNNTSASCSGGHGYDKPTVDAPDIVASNGARYYFTEPFIEGNAIHRVVWVDIDGEEVGRNTSEWAQRNPADIVAFDINDFGDVVPLGYPKVDQRYTQGVVITSASGNRYINAPTAFYQAQLNAFGGVYNEFDVMSSDIDIRHQNFAGSDLRISSDILSKFSSSGGCGNTAGIPSCSIDIVP